MVYRTLSGHSTTELHGATDEGCYDGIRFYCKSSFIHLRIPIYTEHHGIFVANIMFKMKIHTQCEL